MENIGNSLALWFVQFLVQWFPKFLLGERNFQSLWGKDTTSSQSPESCCCCGKRSGILAYLKPEMNSEGNKYLHGGGAPYENLWKAWKICNWNFFSSFGIWNGKRLSIMIFKKCSRLRPNCGNSSGLQTPPEPITSSRLSQKLHLLSPAAVNLGIMLLQSPYPAL